MIKTNLTIANVVPRRAPIPFTAAFAASAGLPIAVAAAALALLDPQPVARSALAAAHHAATWVTTLPQESGLAPATALAVAGVLFFAGLVSGLSGFAFSAVAAAILWLLPPLQAVPLMMLLAACNQLLSIGSLRKDMVLLPRAGREGALPYIVGGLVGVPAGLALLRGLPTEGFAGGLGTFLIAYSALMLAKPQSWRVRLSGWTPAVAVGALGGIVGGFSAFPGSMPVVYLGLRGSSKTETRGVSQPYILTLQAVSLTSLGLADSRIFDTHFWLLFTMTLPAALLGTTVGVSLYRRLSDINFRCAVLVLLALSGLSLLAKAIA